MGYCVRDCGLQRGACGGAGGGASGREWGVWGGRGRICGGVVCVGGYNAYSGGVCGELWCGGVVVCVLCVFWGGGEGEDGGGLVRAESARSAGNFGHVVISLYEWG